MDVPWSTYVDHLIGQRLGPKTIRRYVRWVRDADGWLAKRGSSLETATATEIFQFAEERVVNSHSSRGQAAAALKHYWELCDHPKPPNRAIRVPPQPEMVCRAITENQARDVVKVATGWWMEGTVVLAAMYLALRRFEIAKMEWRRFSDDGSWYTVTGKYDKTATLPVNQQLWAELGPRRGEGWVFPGRFTGSHLADATVWAYVGKVGKAVGINNLEPHELRHTALATANDRTGNLRSVQSFARHANPAVTAGYTRTTARRLREVSDALDYLNG